MKHGLAIPKLIFWTCLFLGALSLVMAIDYLVLSGEFMQWYRERQTNFRFDYVNVPNSFEGRNKVYLVVYFLSTIALSVFMSIWSFRMAKKVLYWRGYLEFAPAWSAVSWWIPGFNFFIPILAFRDCLRGYYKVAAMHLPKFRITGSVGFWVAVLITFQIFVILQRTVLMQIQDFTSYARQINQFRSAGLMSFVALIGFGGMAILMASWIKMERALSKAALAGVDLKAGFDETFEDLDDEGWYDQDDAQKHAIVDPF